MSLIAFQTQADSYATVHIYFLWTLSPIDAPQIDVDIVTICIEATSCCLYIFSLKTVLLIMSRLTMLLIMPQMAAMLLVYFVFQQCR